MGIDAEEVEILVYFLIATAKNENPRYPFAIDVDSIHDGDSPEICTQLLTKEVWKECKQIAQRIPQPTRDIISQKIQTRRDNDPVAQLPESFCQPDSINTQISQTTREISQSPDIGIPSTIRASPTTGTESVSEERLSRSLSPEQPSAQNPTLAKGILEKEDPSTLFFVQDLISWAKTPELFVNLTGIDAATCSFAGYLQALENSQHLNIIRTRFALLQLYELKETQKHRTTKSWLEELRCPRRTFSHWLVEGRNYSSAVKNKGPGVLFSKLRSRTECRKLGETVPARGKKRAIDNLEVKETSLIFTSKELELPKLYRTVNIGVTVEYVEVVEVVDAHDSPKHLFNAAAEAIRTHLKKLAEGTPPPEVDGTQPNKLIPSSNSGMESPTKRARHSPRGGPQDSRSAVDLEISNDPTSYVGQELVMNPMGRVADDGRNDGSGPQNAAVGIRDDQFVRVTSGGTATSSLEPTPVRNLTEDASPSDNQGLSLDLGNSECSRVTSTDYNAMAATPSTRNRQPYTGHAGSGTDQELPQIVSRYGECQQLGLSPGAFQDRDQNVVAGVEHGGCAGDIDEWTRLFPNVIGIDEFGSDQWFRVQ